MAFLFKSKKHQDRGLTSRDGSQGSGSTLGGATSRVREEKGSRSTPTGSLHSIDNDGSMGSPDQSYARQRGQSLDQQPQNPAQMQQQQQQQQAGEPPVRLFPPNSIRNLLFQRRSEKLTSRVCRSAMALPINWPQPRTLRSTPGRSEGSPTPRRTRVPSRDMALRSIRSRLRRAISTLWAA